MSDDPELKGQEGAEGSLPSEPVESPEQEIDDAPIEVEPSVVGGGEIASAQTDDDEAAEQSKRVDIGLPEKDAPPSSGFGHFLKRGLRWAVFLLVVFTIGVVLMQIVRVGPLRDEVDTLNQSQAYSATLLAESRRAHLHSMCAVDQSNSIWREVAQ